MNAYPAAYARELARAYGFPPHAVELVGAWFGKQTEPLAFLVTPRFFEVEIIEGVRLRYWHPVPFDITCPEFTPRDEHAPEPTARGCAHYLPGGRCRLHSEIVCREYARALKRRHMPTNQ